MKLTRRDRAVGPAERRALEYLSRMLSQARYRPHKRKEKV